ncbi:MAG: hypothetical protein KA178_11290 [Alphaproteobacteria bacterium]|nr:hypothetical protein [Alphaproteobacteria bacterium]
MDDSMNLSFPENSLPAFAKALDSGADGIEADVWLTKDRVPVIIHDQQVSLHVVGRAESPGSILDLRDMTLEELKQQDIGGGNTVPTLAELLELRHRYAGQDVIVNLDVKDPSAVVPIMDVLRQEGTDFHGLVVSSYQWDILRSFRKQSDDLSLVPAIKSRILFGEGNIQMPGYFPLVNVYQDSARQTLTDFHREINYSALDCTFTDFKAPLAEWADDLGVDLQISTGNNRVPAKDFDYGVLLVLNAIAQQHPNITVTCKVDEPDLVRQRLRDLTQTPFFPDEQHSLNPEI